MSMLHVARCDYCKKEEPLETISAPVFPMYSQLPGAINQVTTSTQWNTSGVTYRIPYKWFEVRGKTFCSYKCLGLWSLEQAEKAKA